MTLSTNSTRADLDPNVTGAFNVEVVKRALTFFSGSFSVSLI